MCLSKSICNHLIISTSSHRNDFTLHKSLGSLTIPLFISNTPRLHNQINLRRFKPPRFNPLLKQNIQFLIRPVFRLRKTEDTPDKREGRERRPNECSLAFEIYFHGVDEIGLHGIGDDLHDVVAVPGEGDVFERTLVAEILAVTAKACAPTVSE
jgi:hypothetical protein